MKTRSLGIDIGTTFITAYHDGENPILRVRHEGRIARSLQTTLNSFDDKDLCVFTGKGGQEIAQQMKGIYVDEAVAVSGILSSMYREWFKNENAQIIDIGASSLTLYSIKKGKIIDIAQNTLCAAGTGLFLEEQSQRLSMNLEKLGILDIDEPPLIASRCTVFARSDLIHHQQEGRTKIEMWSGLCRSLVVSAVNTLFKGEEPRGEILICGGVSLNKEVLRWFNRLYNQVQWIIPGNSESILAKGASLIQGKPLDSLNRQIVHMKKNFKRMPPLKLNLSKYPYMPEPHVDRNNNEIRNHRKLSETTDVILGMDIGSTSTKLAVLNAETYEPLLDIYGKTGGDPVDAARKIIASFYEILEDRQIKIKAFGTTGSGRKLIGKILGADYIVNEISAQAKGTFYFSPEVETIFEIGGQDAKYIRVQDGCAVDTNMNYVCAAGTGSFIEEQARKLGYEVQEIGRVTEGIAPSVSSDRCTVFMEQDLRTLLREGFTNEEVLASVLYSVIKNYLNRVVGNRPVNTKKIFFQGATARNHGLVAALENLLNVEVAVSPFCHLTGAIGAALIAKEFIDNQPLENQPTICKQTRFLGKDILNLEIESRNEKCSLCRNFCRINHIRRKVKGTERKKDEFSWGYQCGRDPEEKNRNELPGFELFRNRERIFYTKNPIKTDKTSNTNTLLKKRAHKNPKKTKITIVHALTNHTYYPLWNYFFNHLGFPTHISGLTDSKMKKASSRISSADFCFPIKVALAHTLKALENTTTTYVFFPGMIADKTRLKTAWSFFCPYVEAAASVARSTFARLEIPTDKLISPVIDLKKSQDHITHEIYESLKKKLKIKKNEVQSAFNKAYSYWNSIIDDLELRGTVTFNRKKDTEEPVFIIIGRPYNVHEKGLNHGIPEKIASMGYTVIPIDMLKLDTQALSETNYHNVFWKYGQLIIAAIRLAGKHRNIFPVYFTNFNCGPDSFLLTFAEEELKGKPMLILELDEHHSDGGYITRVEAFMDVVNAYMKRKTQRPVNKLPQIYTSTRTVSLNGTIWIPPLHFSGLRVFSAAFRGYGYDCRNLPMEDEEALEIGKKVLKGGECLPMTLTLGNFLKQIAKEKPGTRHILFMPTAEGPCRFGQYNLLERIVFHRLGLEHVDILSPTSLNTYQGLPEALRRQLMHALTASDILFKIRSKIRPYEKNKGHADEIFETCLQLLENVLEKKEKPLKIIPLITSLFSGIKTVKEQKPLVGIVGEIYIRCNPFSNGNLVDIIEANGGESWLSPLHEWFTYTAYKESISSSSNDIGMNYSRFLKRLKSRVNNFYLFKIEREYYRAAKDMLFDRAEPHVTEVVNEGAQYVSKEFTGETILSIGRAVCFAKQGASMVIDAAPFGCMSGTLTGAILLEIKDKFKIPFLSLVYDGELDINGKVGSILRAGISN